MRSLSCGGSGSERSAPAIVTPPAADSRPPTMQRIANALSVGLMAEPGVRFSKMVSAIAELRVGDAVQHGPGALPRQDRGSRLRDAPRADQGTRERSLQPGVGLGNIRESTFPTLLLFDVLAEP